MIRCFDEMFEKLRKSDVLKRIAVVGASKKVAVEAALDIVEAGLGRPVLFGNQQEINSFAGEKSENLEIVDCETDEKSAHTAVDYVKKGEIDIILKGSVPTATLMKAVLRRENGLKSSPVLSDVFIYEDPMRKEGDKRLIGLTDGGLIPAPDLETKIAITESAVDVFHSLGFEKPKVAYISAVEKVTDKIPSTVDAAEIKKRHENGEIKINAHLDGPFAIDNVISKKAAEIKGIDSVMAGSADILVMPNIETGNVLGKLVNYYGNAQNGHVIKGASVPVLITSRADDSRTKLNSVALGILASM